MKKTLRHILQERGLTCTPAEFVKSTGKTRQTIAGYIKDGKLLLIDRYIKQWEKDNE